MRLLIAKTVLVVFALVFLGVLGYLFVQQPAAAASVIGAGVMGVLLGWALTEIEQ